jgi:hypothetical protein
LSARGARLGGAKTLVRALAAALLAVLLLPAANANAGRVLVTGHDADLHCSGGGDQCHFVRVATDYVRAAAPDPSKPVLILDRNPDADPESSPVPGQMEQALDLAYGGSGPPRVVVDPRSSQFALTPLSTNDWSAILVASDESCGGCDLNDFDASPDSDAINARAGEIASFFNSGGGLFFASGAARGDGDPTTPDVYYNAVPLPLGGAQVAEPFALTDAGRALGFVDEPNDPSGSDINCCPTHNSFQEPPADSPLTVAERDGTGAPETLFGDGVIQGGSIVRQPQEPPPPPPPPPPAEPEPGISLEGAATQLTGGTHEVVATAARAGAPLPGARVLWRVEGANPASGQATAAADGKAKVAWKGAEAGRDTLTAFLDLDGNGARSALEPEATKVVDWLAPPKVNRTANVEPVSGTVLVKLPKGARAARYRLGAAQANGFIPLQQASQIPLKSTLDTTRGRVEVQSAVGRSKPGQVQNGMFYSGMFQIRQTGGSRRPVTEMVLNERLSCRANSKKGKLEPAARRKRSRRLWGNGKGRFRTRGRRSSATVRGTQWMTKDSCSTTTTVVKSGVVIVRDFAKRKNVRVKKGKRYVARARARRR